MLVAAGVFLEESNPVQTLQCAQKQLEIDLDEHIQYTICPSCQKPHTSNKLKALTESTYASLYCNGQIYTVKNSACIPNLIQLHVPIIASLIQMFKCLGFAASVTEP